MELKRSDYSALVMGHVTTFVRKSWTFSCYAF